VVASMTDAVIAIEMQVCSFFTAKGKKAFNNPVNKYNLA
jgi:hypothetical protein